MDQISSAESDIHKVLVEHVEVAVQLDDTSKDRMGSMNLTSWMSMVVALMNQMDRKHWMLMAVVGSEALMGSVDLVGSVDLDHRVPMAVALPPELR